MNNIKTLHLIRHAKSSWADPGLTDYMRPLNTRGFKDAAIMANAINDAGVNLPMGFCSSATRAQQTIECINAAWLGKSFLWSITDALYEFSSAHLFSWLTEAFKSKNEVLVVGHNPAMTDLINQLTQADLVNFPTCAYAQIRIKDLNRDTGDLYMLLKPKMFK